MDHLIADFHNDNQHLFFLVVTMDILVIFTFLVLSTALLEPSVYAFWSMFVSAALETGWMGQGVCSRSTLPD